MEKNIFLTVQILFGIAVMVLGGGIWYQLSKLPKAMHEVSEETVECQHDLYLRVPGIEQIIEIPFSCEFKTVTSTKL